MSAEGKDGRDGKETLEVVSVVLLLVILLLVCLGAGALLFFVGASPAVAAAPPRPSAFTVVILPDAGLVLFDERVRRAELGTRLGNLFLSVGEAPVEIVTDEQVMEDVRTAGFTRLSIAKSPAP